ncbi:putative RNA-binding protein, partial [Stegodyphus mimosarum]
MDKKKISNEKRLQAVKAWKKNQRNVGGYCGKRTVFEDVVSKDENKLKLFDSDNEEDNYDDVFNIRPQFEGPRGQQLLEMSSELSSRFKLDERFRDDDQEQCEEEEENDETKKNLKILESVLGHEVIPKHNTEGKAKKRQLMRFDPDDENASKYMQRNEVSDEKKPKKINKKNKCDQNTAEEIPISSERYTEVSCNLKDVLNSASAPFSLSQKFNASTEPLAQESRRNDFLSSGNTEAAHFNSRTQSDATPKNEKPIIFESKVLKKERFFVPEDDPRLKGVYKNHCLV